MTQMRQVNELAKNLRLSNKVVLELCLQLAISARHEFAWILDSDAERVQAKAIKDGLINYENDTGKLFSAGCLHGCPVGWKDAPCQYCTAKLISKKFSHKETADENNNLQIRLVVFDLDGTLANTSGLPYGVRTPYQVLAPGIDTLAILGASKNDTAVKSQDWSFGPNVSNYPGKLIASGYSVAIVTRAPLPYASTLIHLLGISTQVLTTNCGMFEHDKAKALADLAEKYGVKPNEMIYIGDLEEDRFIADLVKCKFATASQLHSGDLPIGLPALATEASGNPVTADPQPSSENNAMSNETQTIDSLRRMIASSIKSGIQDSGLHSTLLKKFAQKVSSRYDKQALSGLAFFSLLTRPGSPSRPYWQRLLFSNIESGSAQCLILSGDGLFQIDPRIITRREINKSKVEDYFLALRHCIPGSRILLSYETKAPTLLEDPPEQLEPENKPTNLFLRAAFKFSSDPKVFGSFLSLAKNHKISGGSGPNVQLGYLDFIADILASYIAELDVDLRNTFIVPVPSSAFSEQKVGQVSTRLALSVGQRLQIPVWPIITKPSDTEKHPITGLRNTYHHLNAPEKSFKVASHDNWPPNLRNTGRWLNAILVEDQSTTGNSIRQAASALSAVGVLVKNAFTYSTSLMPDSSFQNQIYTTCAFSKISQEFQLKCLCS